MEAGLGHFKINRFFYRIVSGEGQAEGFTDFLVFTKTKEKSSSVFGEKSNISHFSKKNRKTTASVLSDQCKVPEQGSTNLSDQVAIRGMEMEFLCTKS